MVVKALFLRISGKFSVACFEYGPGYFAVRNFWTPMTIALIVILYTNNYKK